MLELHPLANVAGIFRRSHGVTEFLYFVVKVELGGALVEFGRAVDEHGQTPGYAARRVMEDENPLGQRNGAILAGVSTVGYHHPGCSIHLIRSAIHRQEEAK